MGSSETITARPGLVQFGMVGVRLVASVSAICRLDQPSQPIPRRLPVAMRTSDRARGSFASFARRDTAVRPYQGGGRAWNAPRIERLHPICTLRERRDCAADLLDDRKVLNNKEKIWSRRADSNR